MNLGITEKHELRISDIKAYRKTRRETSSDYKRRLAAVKKNWINAKYDFHIKINKSVSLIRYFQEHELFKLIVLNCVSSNDMSNFEVTRRIEWEHNSGISQLGTFLLEQKKIKKEVGKKCPLLPGGLEPPTFALL